MPNYLSEKITVGRGTEWELDGLLTLPPGASAENPVPAVVLIHGSGAHDKDETLFENKPFFDIADYLSSSGIAVIRYDKRTFTHSERMTEVLGANLENLTVWEETVEDAILAANLAKADPRIDKNKVFALGHSLGGVLLPRIHITGGDFAGLILFAASPRLLPEIIIDQNNQVLRSMEEGAEKAAVQAQVDDVIAQVNALSSMTLEESKDALFLEMPAYYLKEMALYPFADCVKDIHVPFLVMHADRDLQVLTDVDFRLLKEMLGDRGNAEFRLYEGLNHLFMPSMVEHITEIMTEYEKPAKIDGKVLQDIAAWVLGRS